MSLILHAIVVALSPVNIFFSIIGVLIGIIIGALPGLTSTMGVALFIPITFSMPPTTGLITLAAVYIGSVYGGSISAILINTPGTPAAIITTLDGYKLTQKGEGSRAIGISTISSFIGGLIGGVSLLFISPLLAKLVLKFGPGEIFFVAVLGLTVIVSLSKENMVNGLIAGFLGILLGTIGTDNLTGAYRYTFDNPSLYEGIPLVPAVIGLYSLGQVFSLVHEARKSIVFDKALVKEKVLPTWDDIKKIWKITIKGGIIGTIVGIIPGAGVSIGSMISYNEAKRSHPHPEKFGTGIIEGVAASESGNNGVVGGSLIPLITLGIPGNAVAAVFLGGLMIHGLRPGNTLFTKNINITYPFLIGFIIAHFIMLIAGLSAAKYFARIATFPISALVPVILSLSVIGSYAIRNNYFDVVVALLFGLFGYILKTAKIPLAPLVLGIILGPMAETQLRRALMINGGNPLLLFTSPINVIVSILIVLSLIWPFIKRKNLK